MLDLWPQGPDVRLADASLPAKPSRRSRVGKATLMPAFGEKIGDARINLMQKHAELDERNARMLVRIARETGDVPVATRVLSLLGDERQLRGIPAIGRGVAGAIGGSSPGVVSP